MVKKIQDEHLSVRQTEALVRKEKGVIEENDQNNSTLLEQNKTETKDDGLTITLKFKNGKAKKDALKKLNRLLKKGKCVIE